MEIKLVAVVGRRFLFLLPMAFEALPLMVVPETPIVADTTDENAWVYCPPGYEEGWW